MFVLLYATVAKFMKSYSSYIQLRVKSYPFMKKNVE